MLPVPLNSSKMTSSMRLPVSISAVAMIVRLPLPSMLRAAPKKRFGRWSAFESTPPERILPEWGTTVLCARASRVIESSRITTSLPCSTRRLAFSITMSATCTWRSAGSSKVELITSPLHRALHVGHFFRALVDQQHDQIGFGVIGGDGVGDLLEEDRLAGAGLRDDQTALSLADGTQQIDEPRREVLGIVLEVERLLRVERRQVVEERLGLGNIGVFEVDRFDAQQREVALAVLRAAESVPTPCRRCAGRIS